MRGAPRRRTSAGGREYGTLGACARPQSVGARRGLGSSARPFLLAVSPRRALSLLRADGATAVLSGPERATFESFAIEKRRWDWLAGRLAAKMLVARTLTRYRTLDVLLGDVVIEYDGDGAPRFSVAGHPGLEREWSLSIAHADGYGVCALGRAATLGRVGVDLERDRELRPDLLRFFLSDDERRRLAERGVRASITPVMLWTLKEAVIKAAPRRTERSMWNVRLRWDDAGRVAASIPGPAGRGVRVVAHCERHGRWLLAYAACRPAADGED